MGSGRAGRALTAAVLPLVRASVRHPWRTILAVALVTLTAAPFIRGIRVALDSRSLFPTRSPTLVASDRAARLLPRRDVVAVAVVNPSGVYAEATMRRLARISAALGAFPEIAPGSVRSLATLPSLDLAGGRIDTRPLLDATGATADTLGRLKRQVRALHLDDGVLVNEAGTAAAVLADVAPDAPRQALLSRVRALLREESGGEDRLAPGGSALAQAALGEAAARDLLRQLPVALAVLCAVLGLRFRALLPAAVSMAEVLVSLVVTAGIAGAAGATLFVTSVVLPVVLLAVGVSDDVYLQHHVPQGPGQRADAVAGAWSEAAGAVLLSALSTIVGLLALTFSPVEPLRAFGIFGSIAIAISTLLSFTLVPALLTLAASRTGSPPIPGERPGPRVRPAWRPFATLAAAATLVVACLWTIRGGLAVDDNWIRNLPRRSDLARGDAAFNSLLAGTTPIHLLLDTGGVGGVERPDVLDRMARLEERLARLPGVGAVRSPFDDVVRASAALSGGTFERRRAEVLSGRVPLTDSEVAEARLLLRSTHVQPYLAARGGSGRYAELTLLLRSADYRSIDGVWRAVHDIAPDLVPFGDGWNSYVMVSELVAHQAPGLAGTFAIDFLLLAFWFGAVGRAAIALAPVAVTLAVVFAGLAATGTPIGVANSMFAPVIFGVGTDFSIHLISARAGPGGDGAGAALARRAILTSTLAIGGGFSVLMLSDVLPTFQLGVMLAAGLAVACAATLVLVPALLASRAVHVSSCHEPSRSF